MQNRTVGYLRVSTGRQDIEKNKTEILHFANELRLGNVEWVEEVASRKIHWKERKIGQLLQELRPGDALIVSELSRLGGSLLQCMEILSLSLERGISIYAVKGNWKLSDTLQSKLVAMAFAIASEIERDLISSRTKEALAEKKRRGMILGRPKGPGKSKLDPFRPEIEALISNGSTKTFIAKRYKVSVSNLSRWLQKGKAV